MKLSEWKKNNDSNNIGKLNENNIKNLDYTGVYIFSYNDSIIYIGSAYSQTLTMRLKQYLNPNDTGTKRVQEKMRNGGVVINDIDVTVIPHVDLEYSLIVGEKPKYNVRGKKCARSDEVEASNDDNL